MNDLKDQLENFINERYGSVKKFAESIGKSDQTLYSMLKNGVVGSSLATIEPITSALGIDPTQLARGRVVPLDENTPIEIPLVGTIAAGEPVELDFLDATLTISHRMYKEHPNAFYMKVEGNSMDRKLPNGCYALVDPCDKITDPNGIYAFLIGDNKRTLKRVRLLENGIELIPDSYDPTIRPQIFDYNDPESETVTLIGQVVWCRFPDNWTM